MDRKALLGGLAVGTGVGAGLMFILDPSMGRRRRALAGDKAGAYLRDAEEIVEKKARHLRNRAKGLAAEARGGMQEVVSTVPSEEVSGEIWSDEPRRDDTSGLS